MSIEELMDHAEEARNNGNRDAFAGYIVQILSMMNEEDFAAVMSEYAERKLSKA